jgi:hypothetical protein
MRADCDDYLASICMQDYPADQWWHTKATARSLVDEQSKQSAMLKDISGKRSFKFEQTEQNFT